MSLAPADLQTVLQLDNTTYGGVGPVSPWLSCGGDTVLGRYTNGKAAGQPAVCTGNIGGSGSSTAVFVGAPRPPVSLWRALAKTTGVHLYTADEDAMDDGATVHADAVETGGRGLLFHAGSGAPRVRLVSLPRNLTVVSEWGEVVCSEASPCRSFSTPVLEAGASTLYWLSAPNE